MHSSLSLNGAWHLHWAEGRARSLPSDYVHEHCTLGNGIETQVPEPVQKALVRAGYLDDPNTGLNSLPARWAEDMYWVYRRSIVAPEDAASGSAWLVFDCLDLDAEVWFNGLHPNDPDYGDQHPWGVTLGSFKEKSIKGDPADFWIYRRHRDRFPNEGGVLGASPVQTLHSFLTDTDTAFQSPAWKHHDNFHGGKSPRNSPGGPPIVQQAISLWTGLDPHSLSLEDYVFFSMLLQAEGLTEYVRNFRRRMFHDSAAAIYWMFNDSWPCTHSWPVFDFHFRRKLGFHPLRRAFEPVTVIVAEEDDPKQIGVYGVNETTATWHGTLTWGLFSLDGTVRDERQASVALPPNTSIRLAAFPRREWTDAGTGTHGAHAVLHAPDGTAIAQHRLFVERFGDLAFVSAPIEVTPRDKQVVFQCPAFCWGVTLDTGGESSVADNAFDLLPGVPYAIPAKDMDGLADTCTVAGRKLLSLKRP